MPPEHDADLIKMSETSGRDASEADAIVEQIRNAEAGWERPSSPLSLGKFAWTPALINTAKKRVVHVHLSQRVPRYVATRIEAARDLGYEVHVALHLSDLNSSDLLQDLTKLDAQIYVVDDEKTSKRRHVLAALADLHTSVDIDTRQVIARIAWDMRTEGNNYVRGHRLEAILAFLLAQVEDFQIFSRNYRNETQEIDIVLQVASQGARSWHRNCAFILVEAKNTQEPAGQQQISVMFQKLRTKRGSASIALFFSLGGYTKDAQVEEIRSSTTEYCVAMMDSNDIDSAINTEDLAKFFEDKVSNALLR